jgi:sugar phosphate isomerase/epimerase
MRTNSLSRRTFLTFTAVLPWAWRAAAAATIPVGLEMYSVRDELAKDPQGTVRAVAAMGYQGLEFYAPYLDWTPAQVQEMKALMDGLGIRCFSTHNSESYFRNDTIQRAIDFNHVLGSRYMVMASSQPGPGLDGWKKIAEELNVAADQLERVGLKAGYHNHQPEFTPVNGVRPIEILAKETKPSIMLQLDVGTCLQTGSDPVAWIKANPGRIRSLHLKEWSPDPGKGYSVLFGEGVADWKGILSAAKEVGGAEYFLIEQEGSRFPQLETAKKCLEAYRAKGF